jgi:thymidine phosphorylase
MVAAQGGDATLMLDVSLRKGASSVTRVVAPDQNESFVARIDAYTIGKAAVALGAGRTRKDEDVDPSAGIWLRKKVGERVIAGEVIATLHTSRPVDLSAIGDSVLSAFVYSDASPPPRPLLMGRCTRDGWDT